MADPYMEIQCIGLQLNRIIYRRHFVLIIMKRQTWEYKPLIMQAHDVYMLKGRVSGIRSVLALDAKSRSHPGYKRLHLL